MAQQETTPAGFWAWEPPGKPVRILIELDLVDQMMTAILDGFGSVPKRGAEIGGVLLGSSRRRPSDGHLEVTITSWAQALCTHKYGPSFVLTSEELDGFGSAIQNAGSSAVGYFRSHTREGLSPSSEDLEYCHKFFPGPDHVVLLVHPAGMKPSTAGFFYYEDGELQARTTLEFPFRRSELETGEAPQRKPLGERERDREQRPAAAAPPAQPAPDEPAPLPQPPAPRKQHGAEAIAGIAESVARRTGVPLVPASETDQPHPLLPYPVPSMPSGRIRKNWVWFPLSFVFLLLGVLLGFQAALVFTSGKTSTQDPYALSLGVERRGQDLTVKWDRANAAVRTASKGVLDIRDGRYTKRVELDSSQLQTGSVIYRFSSGDVRFRLEIFPRDRTIIAETVDWKPN